MISQFSGYSLLLSGIPPEVSREELLAYYQNTVEVKGVVMFVVRNKTRLAVMELASVEDLIRSACRYLVSGSTTMETHKLGHNTKLAADLLKRPVHLSIEFEAQAGAHFETQLIKYLQSYGELEVVEKAESNHIILLELKVSSNYSLCAVTTGSTFSFLNVEVSATYHDEELTQQIANELFVLSQTKDRLHNYHQGLGMTVNRCLNQRNNSTLEEQPIPKKTDACRNHAQNVDLDCLSELSDGEWEDGESLFQGVQTTGSETDTLGAAQFTFSMKLNLFAAPINHGFKKYIQNQPSFVSEDCAPHIVCSSVDNRADEEMDEALCASVKPAEATEERLLQPKVSSVSVEERMIDLLEKLKRFGVNLDASFFIGVQNKIDPKTPDSDLLKVSLKILKTKLRKVKRRDRRRTVKALNSEDSDDDVMDSENAEEPHRQISPSGICKTATVEKSPYKTLDPPVVDNEESLRRKMATAPTLWTDYIKKLAYHCRLSGTGGDQLVQSHRFATEENLKENGPINDYRQLLSITQSFRSCLKQLWFTTQTELPQQAWETDPLSKYSLNRQLKLRRTTMVQKLKEYVPLKYGVSPSSTTNY